MGMIFYNKKTQAVEYFQEMIDTPGEFVQHRQLYSALTVTAADASVIAILQSVTEKKQTFSPMFASIFAKPVIGIVTKVDLAESDKDIERAERELRMAGAKHIFYISSVEETGIEELRAYLED